MTPVECEVWATLSLDGELSPEEEMLFQEHVPTCILCQRAWRETKTLRGAVAEAFETLSPAPDWEARFQEKWRTERRPEILTIEDVAHYLRMEPADVWAELEDLPHFRLGAAVRFRRASLEAWIVAQEKRAPTSQAGPLMPALPPALRRTGTDLVLI